MAGRRLALSAATVLTGLSFVVPWWVAGAPSYTDEE